nr:hypothetical protein [Tanacetum cinerariifolium]
FPTRNERLSSGNRDSYVVRNWKPVNRKTTTIKQVFQPVKQVVTPVKKVWKATGKVLPVEHSSSISTSVDVVVSSRFTEMTVTSYKRKARKAPDVSVSTFRPRSSDNKKSVRVSALYLQRKRNLLSEGRTVADSIAYRLERPQSTSIS